MRKHAGSGTVLGALVRHFFGRFFDNEFVAQNTEIQVTVTKMLALLASPGIILPFLRYTTYLGLDATTLVKSLAREGKIILYSSHVLEVEALRKLVQLPSLEDIFSELVLEQNTEEVMKSA
jgi:hypothetical protein